MISPAWNEYPFGQSSYIAAFDDGIVAPLPGDLSAANVRIGQLAQNELQESEPSWRSEGYAEDSYVRVLDLRYDGSHNIRTCNDKEVATALVIGF